MDSSKSLHDAGIYPLISNGWLRVYSRGRWWGDGGEASVVELDVYCHNDLTLERKKENILRLVGRRLARSEDLKLQVSQVFTGRSLEEATMICGKRAGRRKLQLPSFCLPDSDERLELLASQVSRR